MSNGNGEGELDRIKQMLRTYLESKIDNAVQTQPERPIEKKAKADVTPAEEILKDPSVRKLICEKYAISNEYTPETVNKTDYELLETLVSADLLYMFYRYKSGNYLEKNNILSYIYKALKSYSGLELTSVMNKLYNYYTNILEFKDEEYKNPKMWDPLDSLLYHVFDLYTEEMSKSSGGASNEPRTAESMDRGGF